MEYLAPSLLLIVTITLALIQLQVSWGLQFADENGLYVKQNKSYEWAGFIMSIVQIGIALFLLIWHREVSWGYYLYYMGFDVFLHTSVYVWCTKPEQNKAIRSIAAYIIYGWCFIALGDILYRHFIHTLSLITMFITILILAIIVLVGYWLNKDD